MSSGLVSLALLAAGIALIILGAETFFTGLLGAARRVGVSTFFLTLLISGLEVENIAAGLAAHLAGFPGAAAGTFLGGTTFITLGVAGMGAILVPLRVSPPRPFLLTTAFGRAARTSRGRRRPIARRRKDAHRHVLRRHDRPAPLHGRCV